LSFDSFQAFLAMGGHALYVWLAYGLATVVIVYNVLVPAARRRRLIAELRARLRREGASDR